VADPKLFHLIDTLKSVPEIQIGAFILGLRKVSPKPTILQSLWSVIQAHANLHSAISILKRIEGNGILKRLTLLCIRLNLDNERMTFTFSWKPLLENNERISLWEVTDMSKIDNRPVIYRFLLKHPQARNVTVYIGESGSLKKLISEYKYPNKRETRKKVRDSIQRYTSKINCKGWTELLQPGEPRIDLSNKTERRLVEKLVIGAYYQEYKKLKAKFKDIPRFLNEDP